MDKHRELKALATKRQRARWPGYKGIGDYHNGVYECPYVSPYTKTAGNVDAEIMVVLQDWTSDEDIRRDVVWPSGWAWHIGGRSEYLEMIFGVYATLGVFLMIASRDPMANKSLIWFTVWSSFVHGAIMAVQSIADIRHIRHLWGDAPALIVIGAVLAALMPRRVTAGSSPSAT